MSAEGQGSRLPDLDLLDKWPAPAFIIEGQRFAWVNRAFADLLALDRHDLVGHDSVERVHPDDRHLLTAGDGNGAAHASATTQVRMRGGDGAERSLTLTTVRIEHEGRPARLGTAADVTLQPDVLNLSVRMAALGRLAGGIAHDFNNLLLVIGGQIERLRQHLSADGELREAVHAIEAASERAAMLTDQLLSFGRRQMLTPQVLDLSAFVAEMAPQLQNRVGSSIRLSIERAEGVAPVRADRPRLREVLWHLVNNSADAMPSGGTLTIAVDQISVDADLKARWAFLAAGGVFVRLRVTDTGIGMNPEVMPHVFEPFFTTKGRGRGAGMGLASVYGIVKQSAGYVFVERTGRDGTTVTILLPPAAAADESVSVRPAPEVAAAPTTSGYRILLVEDDMAVREMLEDVLLAHGFDVAAAETAEQAELRALDHPFDLLLSDIDLPGASGARLAASLLSRHPELRVILMSGYPDDGEIAAAHVEDALLLRKPFSTTVLLDRIRQALLQRD